MSTTLVKAQNALAKRQTQLNAGIGLSTWGLPLYIGLDHAMTNDITFGGELSFRSYNQKFNTIFYRHSILGIAANANYHFNNLLSIPPVWDFYAGLNLGFYVWSSPKTYKGSEASGLGLGGQIGGRYYFNNKIGINLEFGSGNAFSGGKLGLSIKL